MNSTARKALVSVFASGFVMAGVAAPAHAATQTQDGLINVAVGDVTIEDAVDIGVAAQVAAQICGVKVGPVAVLGRAVDRSGTARTVCETDQGPVTLTQN
jgi:predicted ATP-dependent serine protease